MKRNFLITAFLLLSFLAHSQSAEDALRYSQIYWQGTARSMGAGSAFSALGADFLSASTNPGGMGVYRSYDLSVTAEVFVNGVNSVYNGTSTNASKSMFDLSNIGYVMSKKMGKGSRGWLFYQISFGMNRLNNYNGSALMQGINQNSSRMDVYIEETYDMFDMGYNLDEIYEYSPFYLGPAWDTYLLDTLRFGNDLYIESPVPPGGILQTQQITTKGSNNEYLASFSANYDDVLYIGVTLGLPYIRYFKESVYSEADIADTIPTFNYWSLTENLKTTGWGVNAKVGIVVRPVDWLRLGVAFHTPTYYWNMRDEWNTTTYSDVRELNAGELYQGSYASPEGEYKYKLTTPMRAIGSLAFVINKFGFISAEYEYVNYTSSKFKANDYSFQIENDEISQVYQGTNNLRFGTEWRLSNYSIRGGYAIYSSPYADNINDGARTNISAGLGYKKNSFELNLTYVHSSYNEEYYMYSYANPELDIYIQPNAVQNKITNQHIVLGFRYFFN